MPDRILCSTATRARKTYTIASKAGAWEGLVTYHDRLYHEGPGALLDLIRIMPEGVACVMLVGHQPTWSVTTGLLSGTDPGHFPTAAMACVVVPVALWSEVDAGIGRLAWMQRPREL